MHTWGRDASYRICVKIIAGIYKIRASDYAAAQNALGKKKQDGVNRKKVVGLCDAWGLRPWIEI